MAASVWAAFVGAWATFPTSAALARTAVCATAWTTVWGGIGLGKGNVGCVIKSIMAAWAMAWRIVGVSEGNGGGVNANRRPRLLASGGGIGRR